MTDLSKASAHRPRSMDSRLPTIDRRKGSPSSSAASWVVAASEPSPPPHPHQGSGFDPLREPDRRSFTRQDDRGSSPWSNRRLDLIQVLAPVVGADWVERAGFIQALQKFIRQRGHELISLLRNAHRQLRKSAWSDRVD